MFFSFYNLTFANVWSLKIAITDISVRTVINRELLQFNYRKNKGTKIITSHLFVILMQSW